MQHSKRTLTNLSYHRERRGRGEARNQETLQSAAGIPRIAMSGTSSVRPEHSGSKPSQANHESRTTNHPNYVTQRSPRAPRFVSSGLIGASLVMCIAFTSRKRCERSPKTDWRSSQSFAICTSFDQTSGHTLADHLPFELRKYARHLEHRFSCRCRGVQPLLMQVEIDMDAV